MGVPVNTSTWLSSIVMLTAIGLGLIVVLAGFWFLAPVFLIAGLAIAIIRTRRTLWR